MTKEEAIEFIRTKLAAKLIDKRLPEWRDIPESCDRELLVERVYDPRNPSVLLGVSTTTVDGMYLDFKAVFDDGSIATASKIAAIKAIAAEGYQRLLEGIK